jgi:hypothetical protein
MFSRKLMKPWPREGVAMSLKKMITAFRQNS